MALPASFPHHIGKGEYAKFRFECRLSSCSHWHEGEEPRPCPKHERRMIVKYQTWPKKG